MPGEKAPKSPALLASFTDAFLLRKSKKRLPKACNEAAKSRRPPPSRALGDCELYNSGMRLG